jgi:hypothetical protein
VQYDALPHVRYGYRSHYYQTADHVALRPCLQYQSIWIFRLSHIHRRGDISPYEVENRGHRMTFPLGRVYVIDYDRCEGALGSTALAARSCSRKTWTAVRHSDVQSANKRRKEERCVSTGNGLGYIQHGGRLRCKWNTQAICIEYEGRCGVAFTRSPQSRPEYQNPH